MKSIVWLASYPKSGNTWLRMFLANYILHTSEPMPISKVHRITLGDALLPAYRAVAKSSVDPKNEAAILALRPAVLRAIVANKADINLVKTHNQNVSLTGINLIPPSLTRLALYIVRNPLDMIISYADHYGLKTAAAAQAISAPSHQITANAANVTQYLGSWSDHVSGWTKTRKFPVCTLRYEDMIADPRKTFSAALKRMRVPLDDARLDRAIDFSSFDQLRSQEDEHGFIEKSRHAERFFRSGKVGQWREQLAPDVVNLIIERHGKVMRRFGYLER